MIHLKGTQSSFIPADVEPTDTEGQPLCHVYETWAVADLVSTEVLEHVPCGHLGTSAIEWIRKSKIFHTV